MKHYPKCLYKTKAKTKIAQNEEEHRALAKLGWLDVWTDKEPNQFTHLIKKELEEKKAKIKELEELRKEVEAEEATAKELADKELKKLKGVKNGNGKNNIKSSPKTS